MRRIDRPGTLFFALLIPMLQLFLFGFAVDTNVRQIATVVLDESHTQESRQLLERFAGSDVFDLKSYARSPAEMYEAIRAGKARASPLVPGRVLPNYDKVVGLLDKIQNLRHGIPACGAAAFGTYLGGKRNERVRIRQDVSNGISGKESTRILAGTAWAGTKSGNLCVSGCFRVGLRFCAISLLPGWP